MEQKGFKLKDYYYDLPEEFIAQTPLKDRSSSKLMVLDREKDSISHRHFSDILEYLKEGDCLVLNDTKVIPARLYGVKKDTGASIEVVLLKRLSDTKWEVMTRPGKKTKPGTEISFGDGKMSCTVDSIAEGGLRIVDFNYEGIFEEVLDTLGQMPLPPYITEKLEDKNRYQTVYAKNSGSAAAPTAGLHFTKELLDKIKAKGVNVAYLTLHVGLGTFRPVKVEDIKTHKMHSEFYEISEETAEIINKTKRNGGRVVAVGTTSTRTLETVADQDGMIKKGFGFTDIFIYPGYKFKTVDSLITNFHLPESTLLMLVSALYDREKILEAYKEAIKEEYRFFSFGDAMLIV